MCHSLDNGPAKHSIATCVRLAAPLIQYVILDELRDKD